MQMIKIHYGELSTKGKNRKMFQQRIAQHIRHKTEPIEHVKIIVEYDFMYIQWQEAALETMIRVIQDIPGIARFEPVYPVDKHIDALTAKALQLFHQLELSKGETFKVVAKRSDKNFPHDTYAIQRLIGGAISDAFPQLPVQMKHPTYRLTVQIDQGDKAYLSLQSYQGMQGLPYGSSGRGLLMLSGGFDSPVAGYLAMKRGLEIEMVHFSSPPYTSPQALEKGKRLTAQLAKYGMPIHFINVPFTEVQTEIKKNIHDNESMTVMRRMMLRIMEALLAKRRAYAVINGESLGQVASQTIQSMNVINEVTSVPILRPLITTDKNDIIAIAEAIGTHDISNEPYEDCCTVFAPKSPHTRPKLGKIRQLEEALDIDTLVQNAIDNITIEQIDSDYLNRSTESFQDLL